MNSRRVPRGTWALTGLLTGVAGLATSYATAAALSVRESPVIAVAELVVSRTPGPVAETAIDLLGAADKPVLLAVIAVLLGLLFALAGRLADGPWWRPLLVWMPLAAVGFAAALSGPAPTAAAVAPVGVGLATWLVVGTVLAERLGADGIRDDAATPAGGAAGAASRRGFLVAAGSVAAGSAVVALAGRLVSRGRRQVERTRSLLKLPVSRPAVPDGASLGVEGIDRWRTPNASFYVIHTAIALPTVDPDDWSLRVHGLVDRELTLTYEELVSRRLTESWVTLNCVSNEVGGDLIGNAWWSGVRLADILAEVGVSPEADAVKQTSEDGWTCGTPLAALTDDRDAMLAVGMNGRPLPIEHGFPVRTIVPGLYGFVSATKWVVDLEVTRFADFEAYWTTKGWAERAPVKLASRIDVPGSGDEVPAGEVRVGGMAWAQRTGVAVVEVALDDGAWQRAELGAVPSDDTWVQWVAALDTPPGDHVVRVRATGKDGEVQPEERVSPIPDGATGWHSVDFTATA